MEICLNIVKFLLRIIELFKYIFKSNRIITDRDNKHCSINKDLMSLDKNGFNKRLFDVVSCTNKSQKEKIDLIKELIENGANVNARNENQNNILHVAVRFNRYPLIKFLIDNGADIYAKDWYENSILHVACRFSNKELVEFLLQDKNIDVNCMNKSRETPLCYVDNAEIGMMLINNERINLDLTNNKNIKAKDVFLQNMGENSIDEFQNRHHRSSSFSLVSFGSYDFVIEK